jgi:tetratricopeptide (TPR) repeat protein
MNQENFSMRRFVFTSACIAATALPGFAWQMKPKSQKEQQAVQAMLQAQTPDDRIKAANDLITNFADTQFKSYALFIEADSYFQKNDADKAIVFGEQAIEADPKNYQADVLVAKAYASTTHNNDLDKADKIAKIDKNGHDALTNLASAPKPNPNLPDDQWAQVKNDLSGQAYYALGVAAVYGGKTDDANADFQKTAEMDQDPTDLIRAARAYLDAKKPDQALALLDKANASPQANAQIKSIIASDKTRAQAMMKK